MAHALNCVTVFPEWNLLENPVVSSCAHGTSLPGTLGGHESSSLVWTKQVEQLEAGKPARGGWVAGAGPGRAGKAHRWGITRRRRLQGNTQHHFISWSQYGLWGSEGFFSPKFMPAFLPEATRHPSSARETASLGQHFSSTAVVSWKPRLCLGSETPFSSQASRLPLSHGKRKMCLKMMTSWTPECGGVQPRLMGNVWSLKARRWRACQKGPSSPLVLGTSLSRLCKAGAPCRPVIEVSPREQLSGK